MATINVNGVTLRYRSTPKMISTEQLPLHKKADHSKLSVEKKDELFEKATRKVLGDFIFKNVDLQFDSEEQLKDIYNLDTSIVKLRDHHIKYDMHDVMTVLVDFADTSNIKTVNLYLDHASVTPAQVAASNKFYATHTDGEDNEHILENLRLTLESLEANTDSDLVNKVKESYNEYNADEHGGPLFFKLMMDALLNNSKEAADYLIAQVKRIKISEYDGENVPLVVSQIRSAVTRLQSLKTDQKTSVPDDFVDDIIKVFQMTSVPDFNALFKALDMQSQLTAVQTGSTAPAKQTINAVLAFAELQYRKFQSSGQWMGVSHKASEMAFLSALTAFANGATSVKICFNCGGTGHTFQKCPKPKNAERIASNRKLFNQEKKKKKKSQDKATKNQGNPQGNQQGKWKPPTDAEKRNNNRRNIDGTWYYYDPKQGRRPWRKLKKQPTTESPPQGPPTTIVNQAQVIGGDETSSTAPTVRAGNLTANQHELAVANAQRMMGPIFHGLLDQFNQS